MKSFTAYISKYLAVFITFMVLIFAANLLIFGITFQHVISSTYGNTSPSVMLDQVEKVLEAGDGFDSLESQLSELNIWAIYLDSGGKMIWSLRLPDEIPSNYSLTDVASFSRGYIADYPVFTRIINDNLLVLGYPKDSYTKIISNSYSLEVIKKAPVYLIIICLFNLLMLFLFYFHSKRRILLSTTPLISAIDDLSKGKHVELTVKDELIPVAESINKVADSLNKQNTARANWISGVSHDIRTPLSMIMGYADQLSNDTSASEESREKAKIICNQSVKIKRLVTDFNLVSQLEYDMQPFQKKSIRIAKLLRTYVADLLNSGIPNQYNVEIDIDPNAEKNTLSLDERLITRAIDNLVQNSINHNPDGCDIFISLRTDADKSVITLSDNGIGLTDDKINDINNRPHYMQSTDERLDLRHGLGLLIVKQVISAHNGTITFNSVAPHGFETKITFQIF